MSVTEQEPVIEQPIDSQKSVDSAPIEVAPVTSTKIKKRHQKCLLMKIKKN